MPTQAEIQKVLHYNPKTGIFRWRIKPCKNVHAWEIAGCHNTLTGYRVLKVNGKTYQEHRLAHLYMTGEFPKEDMDHIDHIKTNNKWSNLREVSNQENHKNLKKNVNNKSGVSGVWWDAQRTKWIAHITVARKKIHLGVFKTKEGAVKARKEAEIKYGFHENHGST